MSLALREVVTAFRRAPGLGVLSVFTIAFSLFAFGLFGLVAYNTRLALERLEERVEIRAYVTEGTEAAAVAAAVGDVRAFPEVVSVTYVTPEDALKKARTRPSNSGVAVQGAMRRKKFFPSTWARSRRANRDSARL